MEGSRMNSTSLYVTRGLLLASGLLATGIAATILAAPEPFYAGYGIDVSSNVSLANELKAPAGTLLVAGLLMLVGVVKPEYAVTSLATGSVIYLSYGLSRLLSIAVDGFPHSALVSAAMLELTLGAVCLLGLVRIVMNGGRTRNVGDREEAA
jgi:hypothetical protein